MSPSCHCRFLFGQASLTRYSHALRSPVSEPLPKHQAPTPNHPLVLALIENCNTKDFKRLTGLVPGKDALKFVATYLQRMGYGGLALSSRNRINGVITRRYAVQKYKGNGAKFDPMILDQFEKHYGKVLEKPSPFVAREIF